MKIRMKTMLLQTGMYLASSERTSSPLLLQAYNVHLGNTGDTLTKILKSVLSRKIHYCYRFSLFLFKLY